MAKQTVATTAPDLFVNLPAPADSHIVRIGELLSQLHVALIAAYTPDSGDKGAALKAIQAARPTFTAEFTSATDTTFTARKVYDKGLDARKAAKDAADRLLVMGASEPQQGPARKRNATIAAMSEEEREGLTIASTVNVPIANVQAVFPGMPNTDFLPRMKELGFEVFEKANNGGWYVRVPFNPTPIVKVEEKAPESQDLAQAS